MKYIFLLTLTALTTNLAHAQTNLDFQSIIGGTGVSSADPIAATTIMLVGKEKDGQIFSCTGSIIAQDLILTAAHCTGNEGDAQMAAIFRVKIGGSGPIIDIADREVSQDFWRQAGRVDSDWHDIAILRLAEPIPAGYEIAKLQDRKSALRRGSVVTLAGYGMSVPVEPIDPKVNSGSGVLRKVDQTVINASYGDTEFLISLEGNKGSCHGDSGGPALMIQGKEYFVAGVASRMTENNRVANNNDHRDFSCSKEMVYTSVAAQAAWIKGASDRLNKRKK